jgi:hypothetical protein
MFCFDDVRLDLVAGRDVFALQSLPDIQIQAL